MAKMKKPISVLIFFLVFPVTVQAALIKGHIISFPDDPIKINVVETTSYKKKYSQGVISVQLNISNREPIEAAQFNVILYDVFNRYIDTLGLVTTEKISSEAEIWALWDDMIVTNGWMAYSAIVYLDKVRFQDGTIWEQKKGRVLGTIMKIRETEGIVFEAFHLNEKKKVKVKKQLRKR